VPFRETITIGRKRFDICGRGAPDYSAGTFIGLAEGETPVAWRSANAQKAPAVVPWLIRTISLRRYLALRENSGNHRAGR
jgi:hypothetical protein